MKNFFSPLVSFTFLVIAILACATLPKIDDVQSNTQPAPEVISTADNGSPIAVPTENDIPHWDFFLSKVLTYKEADDYLLQLESETLYNFTPKSGWHTVVAEIAVKGKDWVEVSGCPKFKIIVVDSGGYERETQFGIGRSECYAKTHLPPNGQMMIIAFTEIPDNQEPAKIIVKYFDENYEVIEAPEFNVSDAHPVVFSTAYKIPELNIVPNETTIEIPNTARINFNFTKAYFVDGRPYGYGKYPNANYGAELFIPIRVENIGGQDIGVSGSFNDIWNNLIQVDGIDSNGNVLTGTNIVVMKQSHSTDVITPGQSSEYDLRLAYWSAPTTKLEWLWLGIIFSDGNTFQFVIEKPVAIGLFSPSQPTAPEGLTWFNQPPPSQQP